MSQIRRVASSLELDRLAMETSMVDLNALAWRDLRRQINEFIEADAMPTPEVINMEIVYLMRDPEHPDEWGECEESDPWEKVQYRAWAEVEAP